MGIGGWAKAFGNEVAVSVIADRVCHHCSMINITSRSYKLKDLPTEKRKGSNSRQLKMAEIHWCA